MGARRRRLRQQRRPRRPHPQGWPPERAIRRSPGDCGSHSGRWNAAYGTSWMALAQRRDSRRACRRRGRDWCDAASGFSRSRGPPRLDRSQIDRPRRPALSPRSSDPTSEAAVTREIAVEQAPSTGVCRTRQGQSTRRARRCRRMAGGPDRPHRRYPDEEMSGLFERMPSCSTPLGARRPSTRNTRGSFGPARPRPRDTAVGDGDEAPWWSGREREIRYVGRLGVRDGDHDPLVIDWRAPPRRRSIARLRLASGRHPAPGSAQPGTTVLGVGTTSWSPRHPTTWSSSVTRAAGRSDPQPRRPDARHRRDHPAAPGRGDPRPQPWRHGDHRRSGHRRDRRRAPTAPPICCMPSAADSRAAAFSSMGPSTAHTALYRARVAFSR